MSKNITIEERKAALIKAHKLVFPKWKTWGRVKPGEFLLNDIIINSFIDDNLGTVSLFRHACDAFLCISQEVDNELIFSFEKEVESTTCDGCNKDIAITYLTSAWMSAKLKKLSGGA